MLPGGKLYVPGAEKLLPNIRKLTDAARRDEVFLVSHGCFHPANDPEFQQFPPHCLKGTPGADFVPEALADRVARVENRAAAELPADLSKYQQIVLEKQTLDIFETRHAGQLWGRPAGHADRPWLVVSNRGKRTTPSNGRPPRRNRAGAQPSNPICRNN